MSELVKRSDLGDRYFIVGGIGFNGSRFVDHLLADPSVACSNATDDSQGYHSNNKLGFAPIVPSEYRLSTRETLNKLGWVACVGVESAGLGGPRGARMQRQGSFSQAEYAGKKKQTRRDKFLAEMEQVVPWARLVARLQPLYPKGERGRPPIGLERMLRIYFLQQWYGLADAALEDALYDSQGLRSFAEIDLNHDPVPDATTLLKFRHWLERHDLTRALFDDIAAMLEERC